ncbi:MAG: 2-amino-4-hydroxy-6-hydroxymethyldihydropteridine diphosphokinase [Prolixibacteraceae bacterium]|jgi:2-amino-4-hydroxy-6-hydroxymethyldihydropteridine diphosphokinase|nr:2-amino-4-hydroxy-6-hydroxymethyldihydropteridine diphosphokinase [Prolixibacteraceae bacterium]
MNICIVEMGSNINPEKNFELALSLIGKKHQVLAVSSFLTTEPIGITNQPHFLNGAVKIATKLNRKQFEQHLKSIENELKRDRSLPKYGPRTIDLDIILWNNEVVDDDYHKRDFVKQTVDEIR